MQAKRISRPSGTVFFEKTPLLWSGKNKLALVSTKMPSRWDDLVFNP
jgi:hypothetical protein